MASTNSEATNPHREAVVEGTFERIIKTRVPMGVLVCWVLTVGTGIYAVSARDQATQGSLHVLEHIQEDHETRLRISENKSEQLQVLITEVKASRRDIERLRDEVSNVSRQRAMPPGNLWAPAPTGSGGGTP